MDEATQDDRGASHEHRERREHGIDRRTFLRGAAAVGAAHLVTSMGASAQGAASGEGGGAHAQGDQRAVNAPPRNDAPVPMRPLGKTGLQVSALGLGGFHLGSTKNQPEATEIVARAMDAGVNFFDNAWEYHDGESEERLGTALKGKRDKAVVMTKVCTHGRDKTVAMRMLEESLRRLKTDHLDVWQVHEVIYDNDPDLIFAPDGVAEALTAAKQQGKVRFVGFTGHKDPSIHLRMLSHGFPFDTVQMPLNCLDATLPQLRAARAAGGTAPADRRARHEEPGRQRRDREVRHRDGAGGAALRDEPSRRNDHFRDRLARRAAPESRDRAGIRADVRQRRCNRFASMRSRSRSTVTRSFSRRRSCTMRPRGVRSTTSLLRVSFRSERRIGSQDSGSVAAPARVRSRA